MIASIRFKKFMSVEVFEGLASIWQRSLKKIVQNPISISAQYEIHPLQRCFETDQGSYSTAIDCLRSPHFILSLERLHAKGAFPPRYSSGIWLIAIKGDAVERGNQTCAMSVQTGIGMCQCITLIVKDVHKGSDRRRRPDFVVKLPGIATARSASNPSAEQIRRLGHGSMPSNKLCPVSPADGVAVGQQNGVAGR